MTISEWQDQDQVWFRSSKIGQCLFIPKHDELGSKWIRDKARLVGIRRCSLKGGLGIREMGVYPNYRTTVIGILIGRILKTTSRVILRSGGWGGFDRFGRAILRRVMIGPIATPVNDGTVVPIGAICALKQTVSVWETQRSTRLWKSPTREIRLGAGSRCVEFFGDPAREIGTSSRPRRVAHGVRH